MTIKIYHQPDGDVRITRVTPNGVEQTMCSRLIEGRVVSIDIVVANLATEVCVAALPDNHETSEEQ